MLILFEWQRYGRKHVQQPDYMKPFAPLEQENGQPLNLKRNAITLDKTKILYLNKPSHWLTRKSQLLILLNQPIQKIFGRHY
jgi:hypothetical protein